MNEMFAIVILFTMLINIIDELFFPSKSINVFPIPSFVISQLIFLLLIFILYINYYYLFNFLFLSLFLLLTYKIKYLTKIKNKINKY